MRVRFIKQCNFKSGRTDIPQGFFGEGYEIEVSAEEAKLLINDGSVEKIADKPKAKAKTTKRKISGKK